MGGRRKITLGSSHALRRVCLHLGQAEDIPFRWVTWGVICWGQSLSPVLSLFGSVGCFCGFFGFHALAISHMIW